MKVAVSRVEESFRLLGEGEAENRSRARSRAGKVMLHVMSGGSGELGYLGLKAYTTGPAGARFYVLLFSAEDGRLVSVIAADRLGQIRTGAASGVATRYLAPKDASRVGIYGTGWQARSQLEAIACVRPLVSAIAFGRDEERRRSFCREMSETLGIPVEPAKGAGTSRGERRDSRHRDQRAAAGSAGSLAPSRTARQRRRLELSRAAGGRRDRRNPGQLYRHRLGRASEDRVRRPRRRRSVGKALLGSRTGAIGNRRRKALVPAQGGRCHPLRIAGSGHRGHRRGEGGLRGRASGRVGAGGRSLAPSSLAETGWRYPMTLDDPAERGGENEHHRSVIDPDDEEDEPSESAIERGKAARVAHVPGEEPLRDLEENGAGQRGRDEARSTQRLRGSDTEQEIEKGCGEGEGQDVAEDDPAGLDPPVEDGKPRRRSRSRGRVRR